ncbi:hypothetical protein [Bacillus weihaiensis]|uniref:hypothetical protein n=1 Tax=Bacillus weihaiensis TaxID=1547283 RepID=UPI002355F9CB|nr:hypothetical protein [Bacillus weihaiensis]
MTRQERKEAEKREKRTRMEFSRGVMHFLGATTGFIHGLWISLGRWVGDKLINIFNIFT